MSMPAPPRYVDERLVAQAQQHAADVEHHVADQSRSSVHAAASRASPAAARKPATYASATCQPALSQRPTERASGKQVADRHARRRAEPDHRAAEADGIGEHAPVVAALLERELGQRDVVEHRRDEPEPERRLPRGARQLLDRHQRRGSTSAEQEHRAAQRGRAAPTSPGDASRRSTQERDPDREPDERDAVGVPGKCRLTRRWP